MLLDRHDFADHHLTEGRRNGLQLFDFQTGHGQGISQLLCINGRVAEFAQPGFRKLHELALRMSLELAEKTKVAVKKQPQIVHAVAQHGEPVRTHAESKAYESLGIQSHVAHHIRMYLA